MIFYQKADKISTIILVVIVGGFFFLLFMLFSLSSLRRSLSRSLASHADNVISGLVIIHFGLVAPILIVGMEPRYLAPIAFIPCVVLVFAAFGLREAWRGLR